MAREEREYAKADRVLVPSSFAHRTFTDNGFPEEKLSLLSFGVRVEDFRPSTETIEARCRRIMSGQPLRIIYVGGVSFRKGMWDLREVAQRLNGRGFVFRTVGAVAPGMNGFLDSLSMCVEITPKQPQARLPKCYAWGDLFLFPTIEDGFAVVLAQANASALPILATTNSCGPDFITHTKTGWVVPIRSPGLLIQRLRWCDQNRLELAAMVRRIYEQYQPRNWCDVAVDFERICAEASDNVLFQ
jgi:glycosyltransferase involved in cell wall biosynthesis